MHNKLEKIILQKELEVKALEQLVKNDPRHRLALLARGEGIVKPTKSFKAALRSDKLSVIAEIKRRSPSKGALATIEDPIKLAQAYTQGGAAALSILTDKLFFDGSIDDLAQVATALENVPTPLLRKDFIIDHLQIAEASLAKANAILAIVSFLAKNTEKIIQDAKIYGLDVLVEVHSKDEIKLALDAGAEIIGINNRNLNTFEIDTLLAFELIQHIPKHIITVAESGIHTPQLARAYRAAGFDAVLIGESLVTSNDPQQFINECIVTTNIVQEGRNSPQRTQSR